LAGHFDVLFEVFEIDFQRLICDVRNVLRAENISNALVLFIEFGHDEVLPSVKVEAIILTADLWYPDHRFERYGEHTIGMIRRAIHVGNHSHEDIEVGDGSKHRIRDGSALLAENTTGQGDTTLIVDGGPVIQAVIPLADEA
jgi:hypothetical protein